MADEPPFNSGCERCGEDRPWTMVTGSDGVTLALCGECIEAFAATQWTDDDAAI